jgi:bifunctional enzyme CysN/CysC
LLRTATDVVAVAGITISAQIDLDTLLPKPAEGCAPNDIVAASISFGRPTALDPFGNHQETGAFLLVDALTGATLAAGTVLSASSADDIHIAARNSFRVTHDMLAKGLCADLGKSEADAAEYHRRALEVARLFEAAGIAVSVEDRRSRDRTVSAPLSAS